MMILGKMEILMKRWRKAWRDFRKGITLHKTGGMQADKVHAEKRHEYIIR